jgi:hypothetical protein
MNRNGNPAEGHHMRHVVIGFCFFATACAGAAPTAPSSPLSQIGAVTVTEPNGTSELTLKGNLEATELVNGSHHELTGTGTGTHLGRFTYEAVLTVDHNTGVGVGTVTWTAANCDKIFADTRGEIVLFTPPAIGLKEEQVITGGTGRFAGATGDITVERIFHTDTGITAGSFTGTITVVR